MRIKTLTGVMLLLLAFAMTVTADEAPWYDMENCEMCKSFSAQPGLMENMSWEQYKISNGFVSMSTVAKGHMDAYNTANAACDALGDKMATGEEVALCGSCVAMGGFFAKGATMEQVETSNGGLMLVTSSDAELVTAMHAWADRNAEEMSKMMEHKAMGHDKKEGKAEGKEGK